MADIGAHKVVRENLKHFTNLHLTLDTFSFLLNTSVNDGN